MIVQACLNGARAPGYHPRLPLSPRAVAEDGAACVTAGAAELHVHPRDRAGVETLAAVVFDETITELRRLCPGTQLGVSTGAWIAGSGDGTLDAIDGWRALPDYASVNLSEAAAPAVMDRLWKRGIGVEAGLGSIADAERLLASGLEPRVLRILIELGDADGPEPHAMADAIDAVLAQGGCRRPRLLHGCDGVVWRLVTHAARRGFSTRIGLEDGDRLPDGTVAADNAALVRAAVDRSRMAPARPQPAGQARDDVVQQALARPSREHTP